MTWRIRLGEFLKETGLGHFLLLGLAVALLTLLASIYALRVDREPIQVEHVEVVSKRLKDRGYSTSYGGRYNRFVTFKFPDDSEKEFNILYSSLDDFQEGDRGVLSYKQIKDSTELRDLRFVSFKKDE